MGHHIPGRDRDSCLICTDKIKKEEIAIKIKPLSDRVLVLRIGAEQKTKGGIVIPDAAKEKPQEGKVVAVGSGKMNEKGKRISLDVKTCIRILVIENNPSIRMLYREELFEEGYHVTTCDKGSDIMDLISEKNPDLVMTDDRSGGKHGLDLSKSLIIQSIKPIAQSEGDIYGM